MYSFVGSLEIVLCSAFVQKIIGMADGQTDKPITQDIYFLGPIITEAIK